MSKRSETVVLTTLVVGVAGAALWSGWRESQYQPLLRNRYHSAADCECAYSPPQCRLDPASNHYLGPWYLRDEAQRRRDPQDPGPGRDCEDERRRRSAGAVYGGRAAAGPEVERGHRYGFGGTARSGAGAGG